MLTPPVGLRSGTEYHRIDMNRQAGIASRSASPSVSSTDMDLGDRHLGRLVARLIEAISRGEATTAAHALGSEHGAMGRGLEEALEHVERAFREASGTEPPLGVLRAVTTAWADEALGALLARGALDHRTGLATFDYLLTRLRDLARVGAAGERRLVAATWRPAQSRFAAMLETARVAARLAEAFPSGETPAHLASGRVAILVPADERFTADLAAARLRVSDRHGVPDAEVVPHAPPGEPGAVGAFLRSIAPTVLDRG